MEPIVTEYSIKPHTSAQIAIVRPICIFFMLYVHVNPGFDAAVHSGAMLYLGTAMVDFLGRTSVAALSLISGFLLAYGTTCKASGTLIWGRIRVLYLPMLVSSAIFLALAFGGAALLGYDSRTSRVIEGVPLMPLILEKLMFLYGQPASQALGFLRDLTASSIVLILLLRIPGKAIVWCAILLVLGIDLFGTMEPLVYRPKILLFMLGGAAFFRRKGDLSLSPSYAILAALTLAALIFGESFAFFKANNAAISEALNVMKRMALTVLALTLSGWLVSTGFGAWLRGISDDIYLAYLYHVSVLPLIWAVWKLGIGDEAHWAYVFFFLMSPVLVLTLLTRVNSRIDYLPRFVQIALRGKARVRR